MIRTLKVLCAAGLALAVSACASAPKDEDAMNVAFTDDGRVVILGKDGKPSTRPEDQAIQALLNQTAAADAKEKADKTPAPPAPGGKIWKADADGNLVHMPSGAICYKDVADLPRADVTEYEPDGSDVSCNYTRPGTTYYLTFYVFRADLEPELDSAMQAMKARQPSGKETPYGMESKQFRARTLAYADAKGVAMRTSALFTEVNGWLLEVRLTCEAANAKVLEQTAALGLIGQADRLRGGPPAGPPAAPPDKT